MCGIISYFSNDNKYNHSVRQLLHDMLWIGSIRGDNSTGLIYEEDGSPEMYKRAIPGWDFVQLKRTVKLLLDYNKTPYFIGHNRAATRGDVNTSNAHPFEFGDILGIHNGTLTNHHALSPVGAKHEVDSQHLYHAISENGFAAVVPRINGSFNLLWHDKSDNTIHLCKNETRPYSFAKIKDKDMLIGASEKSMLKWLVKKHGMEIEYCWDPKDNMEYIWEVGVDMVKPSKTVQHKGYVAPPVTYGNNFKSNYPAHQNRGAANTVVYLPKTPTLDVVEFYVDTCVWNMHITNGYKTGTFYGKTAGHNSKPVIVYGAREHELVLNEWYKGSGLWTRNTQEDYYNMEVKSIKIHPLADAREPLVTCSICSEDYAESDGVIINDTTLCLPCAVTMPVNSCRISDDDLNKLHLH
jgi:predicted glutamine amidotransferase